MGCAGSRCIQVHFFPRVNGDYFLAVVFIPGGEKIIAVLHRKQVGETIRELGLEGQLQKQGTPTMGGLIIIAAILIPTLLFARLENVYIILMIITTVWLGFIGF